MPPKKTTNNTVVQNINGTSQDRYVRNNLSYSYLQAGGYDYDNCQVPGCSNKATATAHVMKSHGNSNNDWYLTKLCAHHNSSHNDSKMKVNTNSLIQLSKLK